MKLIISASDKMIVGLIGFKVAVCLLLIVVIDARAELSDAELFAKMKDCYKGLLENRAGMDSGDKPYPFVDYPGIGKKPFLVLPGTHAQQSGVFIQPFDGGEAAFVPTPPKKDSKPNDPVVEYIIQVKNGADLVPLHYEKAAQPTDTMVANVDFKMVPKKPYDAVADKYEIQGTEVMAAYIAELTRRLKMGMAYYDYLGGPLEHNSKPAEGAANLKAALSCREALKTEANNPEFKNFFTALTAAEGHYPTSTLPTGSTNAPTAPDTSTVGKPF